MDIDDVIFWYEHGVSVAGDRHRAQEKAMKEAKSKQKKRR